MSGKVGRPRKTNRKVATGFRLDKDVRSWLDREALKSRQTVSSYINSHFRDEMLGKDIEVKVDEILALLREAKSAGKL